MAPRYLTWAMREILFSFSGTAKVYKESGLGEGSGVLCGTY